MNIGSASAVWLGFVAILIGIVICSMYWLMTYSPPG
jgi:hypothetical protein